MNRYLHQPFGQCLGIAKLGKLANEIQANGLKNVRCFFPGKAVTDRNGENEVFVLVHQQVPILLAVFQAALDEFAVGFCRAVRSGLSREQFVYGHVALPALRRNS